MMVAVAIIAILAGIGAASFAGISARVRVASDASDLLHAIELTRAEGMTRRARITLAPADAGAWTSGWIVFIDSNGNRRWDAGEPVIYRHPALTQTTTVTNDTTPGYIAFGSQGRPVQYGGAFLAGTIALCDAHVARSIVLAKSGRARLVAGSC